MFHSVSAINNAGFDIVGNSSLSPYNGVYIIQFIFVIEFVIGGIGFPTFYDLSKKISAKYKGDFSRLTLFTKLNLVTYFTISILGLIAVGAIETIHKGVGSLYAASTTTPNFLMNVFFNVMSTRNAGFSTVNAGLFQPGSKLIMSVMMFIGSAPSSTAGGIRTTTLSVMAIAIISVIRNDNVTAFKRKIPNEITKRAFSVFVISALLMLISTLMVVVQYNHMAYIDILFILSSAFGTTGLSTLTIDGMLKLSAMAKIVMILLMLVGQIGISNTLLMFKTTNKKEYKLIEENVTIG